MGFELKFLFNYIYLESEAKIINEFFLFNKDFNKNKEKI